MQFITIFHSSFTQGIEHSQQGQFEAAITCFNKATNLQSQSISFYIERAETFIQLCDFNSAALNYKHAYTLEPHNPFLSDKMAFICYLEVGFNFVNLCSTVVNEIRFLNLFFRVNAYLIRGYIRTP